MIRNHIDPMIEHAFISVFHARARSPQALALWDRLASIVIGRPCEFWLSPDDVLRLIQPRDRASVRALGEAAAAFLALLPLIPDDNLSEVPKTS